MDITGENDHLLDLQGLPRLELPPVPESSPADAGEQKPPPGVAPEAQEEIKFKELLDDADEMHAGVRAEGDDGADDAPADLAADPDKENVSLSV